MAKNAGLKKALAEVKKLDSQMRREGIGDYKVALSANTAISGNLGNVVGRLERPMLKDVLRSQRALGAYTQGSKRTQQRVRRDEAGTVSRYGSAMGAAVNAAYAPASAVAASSVQMQRGAEIAGVKGGRAAQTVAALGRQGVAAIQAAGEYALATALQQRNIVDSQTIAQLTGQAYQAAIDYNNQVKLMKLQHKLATEEAEKAAGTQGRSEANYIVGEGTGIAVGAADTWRDYHNRQGDYEGLEEGAKLDVTAAAETWATQNGYAPGGPEMTVYAATLRRINQGMNADAAYQETVRTLYGHLPGWERWGEKALMGAGAGVRAEQTRQAYLDYYNALNPDGGGGGDDANRHAGMRVGGTNEGAVEAESARLGLTKRMTGGGAQWVDAQGNVWVWNEAKQTFVRGG